MTSWVVAALLVDDLVRPTRLLAARRTAPAQHAGRWEIPGGKVEQGESHEQALHRELAEELGIDVVLGDRLDGPVHGGWPLDHPSYVMAVHRAVITQGSPVALQDHDELRWLTEDTLPGVPWIAADLPIVRQFARESGWRARG